MNYIIVNFEKSKTYIEHFEIMVETKYGYQPVMTSHPLSGDRPKMFDKKDDAERFIIENKEKIKDMLDVDLNKHKIIFVPKDENYNQHFEILSKGLFFWKTVDTFHPISGDKPKMFNCWNEAKDEIFLTNTKKNTLGI